jgi:hypothetical protein
MYDYDLFYCFFFPVLWIRIQTGRIRNQYQIRPILPNEMYNFVNLYFKVVKFVFGYNYSSLEILKLHNKVLL